MSTSQPIIIIKWNEKGAQQKSVWVTQSTKTNARAEQSSEAKAHQTNVVHFVLVFSETDRQHHLQWQVE
jgi:hypothetical protein